MNDMELDQRENRVIDFINKINHKNQLNAQKEALNNNTDIKLRALNKMQCDAKSDCINAVLGRVYKDALPFDDPDKCCDSQIAQQKIKDFIANKTNGKTSEWYIKEAIRKTQSPLLKDLDKGTTEIVNDYFKEKAKNIGSINISDLNFKIDSDNKDVVSLSKKMELDEVSNIIRDNVKNDILRESERAKAEEEYKKNLEEQLANDPSVVDDNTMESAITKMTSNINTPKVYQPSLFEAVMIHNTNSMKGSSMKEIMTESVHEYTLLNISKALKLESYNINNVKKLASDYVK